MKFWLLLVLSSSFFFPAQAEEARLLATKDKTALDFERVVVEENLKAKILSVVAQIVPEARFNLNVAINYKIQKPKEKSVPDEEGVEANGDYIHLGKFGVVAPAVSDELLNQDLISNIGFIRITFIFYDHIDPKKTEFLTATVKKLVDIVPVWRLRVEMVVPPPAVKPEGGLSGALKFKSQTLVGVALGLLGAVALFFVFVRLRDEVYAIREALKKMRSESVDEPLQKYQRPSVREDFTAPESVIVFEAQSQEMPDEGDDPPHSVGNSIVPLATVNQAFEFLALSSPESEEAIFDALAWSGRTDLLQKAAYTYCPASLTLELPAETLARAFSMLDVHEKTGLILSLGEDPRALLMNSLSGTARAFFEHELQKLSVDATAKLDIARKSALYWKQYVDVVRQLLRASEHLAPEVEALIQDWVKDRIKRARRAS